ncbi:MAG: GNAT family N-acetyltransferase [Betaproteobacteria bacterium]
MTAPVPGADQRLPPALEAGSAAASFARMFATDMDPALLQRIEDSSLNASAPPQQRWLDGWLVRYCPGKAKRARCINAVALGQRSAQAKLAECAALFAEVGLPLVVRLTPFTLPAELDAQLAAQGWPLFDDTRVMVQAGLAEPVGAAGLPPGWTETLEGPEAFARTVGALRGSTGLEIAAHAQRVEHSPVPYTGLVWRDALGAVQACGQFAREADLVGLYDIFTAPLARGQGLATALCARLLAQAHHQGARTAYLQVDAANGAARKVYTRLRFQDAYTYHYRSSEAGAH